MDRLMIVLMALGGCLLVLLLSALILAIPSMILAWLVLKMFPQITLSFIQLTNIFAVVSALLKTKVTIEKNKE